LRFIHDLEPGKPFNPFRIFKELFIPDALAAYPGLSPGAKLCYGALVRFGGKKRNPWPSVAKLSVRLGVTDRQVQRYLAELITEGFISRTIKRGYSSRFHFLWHTCFSGRATLRRDVHTS
jgi:hypothetical protein